MNTLNNAHDLMTFGKVLRTIHSLGLTKYIGQIVRAEKTESETLIEILNNEALTRNQEKVIKLAQRITNQVGL